MTEAGNTPEQGPVGAVVTSARSTHAAKVRTRPRRRHVAKGARIAAAGIGATTMAGLVGIWGYTQQPSKSRNPETQVAVVASASDTPGVVGSTSLRSSSGNTTLTIRPNVRSASPTDLTPAATTNGSN